MNGEHLKVNLSGEYKMVKHTFIRRYKINTIQNNYLGLFIKLLSYNDSISDK